MQDNASVTAAEMVVTKTASELLNHRSVRGIMVYARHCNNLKYLIYSL